MSNALDRIAATRARLRLAMLPPPAAPPISPTLHAGRGGDESLLHRIRTLPLVRAVMESVSSWWAHHPMRPMAHIATEASSAVVKPIAQEHPWSLVFVAGAVGAGLAWTRPWRWIFRSALFAGLVPQLATRVVSSLPLETWMSMASGSFSQPRATRARPTQPPTA